MTPQHWREIEDGYHAAMNLTDSAARAAYLAQLDPEVRAEVEELLAQRSQDSPLEHRSGLFETLTPGAMLGHYRIEQSIGAGGMGEVYRATDTKLRRSVAIKVCGTGFIRRFEREARAIAALNHPNICTLYESGPDYLVMELVEGPTLADRIRKGAIPINEAIDIARQIAEALEAAHEHGIIHRDLKPANMKLTSDGRVKVLDFGLAKSTPPTPPDAAAATITNTEQGLIVGTPSYMSPEQAEGLPTGKHTDIWSFGVVFWEMLTGHRLFDAQSASRILSEVLQREIDFDKLPAAVPDHIRTLLRRCLDRNLKTRLRDIGEARVALVNNSPPSPSRPKRRTPIFAVVGWTIAAITLAWFVLIAPRLVADRTPAVRAVFQFTSPEHNIEDIDISPDGKTVLIVGGALNTVKKLWVRPLDKPEAKLLATVEGIQWWGWSPDSESICYQVRTQIYRISRSASQPAVLLGETPELMDRGVWVDPGIIIVGTNEKFFRFRVEDRTVTKIYDHGGVVPRALQPGRFLFYRADGIYVGNIDGRPAVRIAENTAGLFPYVSAAVGPNESTYLFFARDNSVLAQPFDAAKLTLLGSPVPIFEGPGGIWVSQSGVMITNQGSNLDNLAWVDRTGKLIRRVSPGISLLTTLFHLSPDETRAEISIRNPEGNYDIWIANLESGTISRLTFAGAFGGAMGGIWSPDSRNILWSTRKTQEKYLRRADGSGSDTLWFKFRGYPTDWSPDGKLVISNVGIEKGGLELWTIPVASDAEHKPAPYLQAGQAGASRLHSGQFYPDGKWVAYVNHTMPPQIFVESFPPGRGRWQVTTDGANEPRWRRDGKELFFFHGTEVWTVPVKKLPSSLEFGKPQRLFDLPISANMQATRDGQRFLVNLPVEQDATLNSVITVDTDWRAGLLGKQP